jgi:hypothetical protein
MESTIVNWSVVNEDQIYDVFLKMIYFEDMSEKCNYSIKKFHSDVVGFGIKHKAIKSDWDVKNFVFELINIPFDYENMTDNQMKFLRAISKRYLITPLKFKLEDYINEKKQMKFN